MQPVRVHVIDRSRTRLLQLVYRDPRSGRKVTRSSGTTNRRDAERAAARWEDELNSQQLSADGSIAFGHFVDLLDERHLKGLRTKTRTDYLGALEQLERYCQPQTLRDVTSELLTEFVGEMRADSRNRSEETIRSRLAAIRASINWGVDAGLLPYCPRMPRMPRRRQSAGGMRGRPLSDAEFKQIIDATPDIVGTERAPAWQHSLNGLWLSGLRLGEAIELSWDRSDVISVDLSGERPMFRIPPGGDKSGKGKLLPITPDFAAMLEQCETRSGNVFGFPKERPGRTGGDPGEYASKTITKICRHAGVLTSEDPKRHASAHDLRRSFGARWSRKVMPQVLQLLMRHESIETTMRYYVGQDVQHATEVIWQMGGEMGGTQNNATAKPAKNSTRP